ncbi:MAG: thymidine phosphorylase [Thermoanaerobaculaceae bacterium]
MNFVESIARKRDGGELSREEIWEFVQGAVTGRVPDVQLAAMLMAICIRGASPLETRHLVEAMTFSGERWELGKVFPEAVDKHSTGGVGDTVSLVFAPWLAACGVPVAMMAGAGLGHTQGTLDKLAAIPGFATAGTKNEALARLDRCGAVFCRQSEVIAPADRKLYALRDVTATVPSLPLIVASIMSKKLAVGASRLVLDVKCGSGAFRKTLGEAQELARALVEVAAGAGVAVKAVISSMDEPLGPALGCAEEVREALACLGGCGDPRLFALTRELVLRGLALVGKTGEEAASVADAALRDGRALAFWERIVEAHGGNPDPHLLPTAKQTCEVAAPATGYLQRVDGEALGFVAVTLGAGRRFPGDAVDPSAFLRLLIRRGERVKAGEPVVRFGWSQRDVDVASITSRLQKALVFSEDPPTSSPLLLEELGE